MGELITRALQELRPKGPVILATRALRPHMNPRERLGQESVTTRVEITTETKAKLKEARQIMGGRLIMPGAVESALGTQIDQRLINEFPFTKDQLRTLRHDSVIMYFADETDKGAPITMNLIDKKRGQKTKQFLKALFPGKGDSFDSLNKRQGQKFFETETPRPGWRSVTLDVVPGTQDMDALGQIRTLISYLQAEDKKVLGSSEKIVKAIEEFDQQEQALSHLMPFYPDEGAQRLTELAIAKLTMPTAVELAYAYEVLGASSDRKFLESCYSSTLNRDSGFEREIIQIRNGGRDKGMPGVRRDDIFGMNPNRYYSDHGVVLSLGAEALPTPPQPEEPKTRAIEVVDPMLIPFITEMKEIPNPPDLPFDPERDISEKDWEGMIKSLASQRNTFDSKGGRYYTDYYKLLDCMKTVSPRRFSLIDQSLLPQYKDFNTISDREKSYDIKYALGPDSRLSFPHIWFAQASIFLKQAFPEKDMPWSLEDFKKACEKTILHERGEGKYHLEFLALVNTLFPNWVSENFLDDHNTKREKVQSTFGKTQHSFMIEKIMEDEVDFRLLTRDNNHRIEWDLVKHAIDRCRSENNYERFAKLCKLATLLSAEEVKITGRGLEITMRKPEQKTAPAILTDRKADAEPVFDPERDIPEEDRENLFTAFKKQREERDSENDQFYINKYTRYLRTLEYVNGAVALRRLFPERYRDLKKSLKPDKDDYYILLNKAGAGNEYSWDNYLISDSPIRESLEAASAIRKLFGKKWSLGLEEKKEDIELIVKEDLTSGRPFDHLREYANLNMIFPNWITQDYALEHFTPERLQHRWSKVDQENANIGFMLQDEASFRIITGKQFHFVDRNLIQREIQWARENKKYDYLASIYENLLISTAEDVRVTDRGLGVNPRKPAEKKLILPQWTF